MNIEGSEVKLEYPAAAEVKNALLNNADLLGEVTVSIGGTTRSAMVPLPYEGVFVVRNFNRGRADMLVWGTYLHQGRACTFQGFLHAQLKARLAAAGGNAAALNLDGLVPVLALRKKDLLLSVRPRNPLELLTDLNGIRRYRVSRGHAALYGAEKRMIDASFEGRICPIETPESELIGIHLQLARGAEIADDGEIRPAPKSALLVDKVGWGASLVPFLNHNDSARNTIGAKNLRQALPLEGREAPLVKTGTEADLVQRMEPLLEAGLCPSTLDANGELALGCNLLVAYLPWFGWNIEDAVVVSESAARKLAAVKDGRSIPLALGDKLTGRHGNKGVVSRIEPDERMPSLPDGRRAEILLNPHGIISRMNPGQLLETHVGWALHEGVSAADVMRDGGVDHPQLRKQLTLHGLDDRGRVKVGLPDGTTTENPVVVGYQYFVRLDHIPSEKSHADRTQRLGEMEVWALAANEATDLLKEKLGTDFETLFKDWLLVLGIGLKRTDKGIKFRKLDDEALLEAMGDRLGNPPGEVTAAADQAGYTEKYVASFGCPKCNYSPDADMLAGSGKKTLKMGELVQSLGVFGTPKCEITEGAGKSKSSTVYKLTCTLLDGRKYLGYYQSRSAKAGVPDWKEFDVVCDKHQTQKLERKGAMRDRKFVPGLGGLFDEGLFTQEGSWAYLRLKKPAATGLEILPVLPLKYRRALRDGVMDTLSAAYVKVIRQNGTGRQAEAVDRLLAEIKFRLFGLERKSGLEKAKQGLVRRMGLGRQVDHAARQVAVPNPELAWNEVGVPVEIYKSVTENALLTKDDVLVLNRQPTLHRYGMQAFHPKLMDGNERVFQMSPLCCGGFAIDFDGDEVVAHYPVGAEAQQAAWRMLADQNLVSDANGRPTVHFKLDFRSGAYLLGKGEKDIADLSAKGASAVQELSELSRKAFAAITKNGASFGFYDFMDRSAGRESAALKLIFDDARANGKQEQMDSILKLFVAGMSWERFFEQANDGRMRLCTKKLNSAKAGGLTRRLVLGLWARKGVEGLRAAQAIGERGLQLTQAAAHGGGFDINKARKVFLGFGKEVCREQLPEAYRDLKPEILALWNEVFGKGADWKDGDAFSRLAAGKDQLGILEALAESEEEVGFGSPFGKVFFNEL